MTTNNMPEPQGNFKPQGTDNPYQPQQTQNLAMLPPRYEPAAFSALPEYDEVTPGEPAQYVVPAEYRRPFGQAPRDKRGKFWTIAFASAISALISFIVLFTPFAVYGINVVAALAAVILGVRALILIGKSPRTSFSGKAKLYSWLGTIGGAINLLLTILAIVGIIALFSFFKDETDCSVYGADQDSYHCEIGTNL